MMKLGEILLINIRKLLILPSVLFESFSILKIHDFDVFKEYF